MFARWRSIQKQQHSLLPHVDNPAARAYLSVPLPDKNTPISEVDFLSLDFETTGLEAKSEAILSMGYMPYKNGRISLAPSTSEVIRLNRPLNAKSVVIHHITDDRMKTGVALHDALDRLLEAMAGKVLLVHYSKIERDFLAAATKRVYGKSLPFMMVDTMMLEKRKLDRNQQPIHSNQLRLANLRKQYHLPPYGAHNALEDAIATAELFMAQLAQYQQGKSNVRLGELLC
jgi:DNA polymerase-3 subunit epsilon